MDKDKRGLIIYNMESKSLSPIAVSSSNTESDADGKLDNQFTVSIS